MDDSRPKSGNQRMSDCGRINKQLLKLKAGEFDLESIHSVVLRGLDISDLGCVGECVGLERLDLSKNDVTKLYALAGLTSLTHLNLSANRISSLEGLQALDNLRSLNLAGNLIGSASALKCLSCLENLTDLRMKDSIKDLVNPMCMNNSYKKDVLDALPNLVILDGERVSGKGSDLYTMCDELDKMLQADDLNKNANVNPMTGPWLSSDFHEKSDKEFENSNLADAQQQLEALLEDCTRVSRAADEKMKSLLPST